MCERQALAHFLTIAITTTTMKEPGEEKEAPSRMFPSELSEIKEFGQENRRKLVETPSEEPGACKSRFQH
jgi:hypothetical protein